MISSFKMPGPFIEKIPVRPVLGRRAGRFHRDMFLTQVIGVKAMVGYENYGRIVIGQVKEAARRIS